MRELPSHARCCRSALDRARHELDRGLQAAERRRKKLPTDAGDTLFPMPPKRPVQIKIDAKIMAHIDKWTRILGDLERTGSKAVTMRP